MLAPNQGLRLRLRLDPALADLPWEYLYVQRGAGEKDATGFLALDPRLSLVRHEALPLPGEWSDQPRPRRLLVAMASPEASTFEALNLDRERTNLAQALAEVEGIQADYLDGASPQSLGDALLPGADAFHFAGHGVFSTSGIGPDLQTVIGEGAIVLEDEEEGGAVLMAADQLAVSLRGRGVQLVFLGACQTGRRDGQNVWSGVAAALMEAGVPAVVAMQYKIEDENAIVFSRTFYRALAAGLPLDQAVTAGRLAIFNRVHPLRDNPVSKGLWRDWGVPVMYFRSQQAFVLPALTDPDRREAMAAGPRTVVDHRFDGIAARGKYRGVEAGVVAGGSIGSYLKVGVLKGKATQVDVQRLTDGEIEVRGEADVVEGEWTGVRVGNLGESGPGEAPVRESHDRPICSQCGERVEATWRVCAHCGRELTTEAKFCHQCGAELTPKARFCQECGTALGDGERIA